MTKLVCQRKALASFMVGSLDQDQRLRALASQSKDETVAVTRN